MASDDLVQRSGLTPEEVEGLGGVKVVTRHGLALGQLLVLGTMFVWTAPVFAALVGYSLRASTPLWAAGRSVVELAVLLAFMLILGGWTALCAGQLLHCLLRAWAGSPALVAGTRGLRIHGGWPWPATLTWREVKAVTVNGTCVMVWPEAEVLRNTPWIVRFLSSMLGQQYVVHVVRGADTAALRTQLLTLKAQDDDTAC